MGALDYSSPIPPLQSAQAPTAAELALVAPDRRDGLLYDCEPELEFALHIALTTSRPLLLRGNPGSGKSSFAAFVARNLGWRYYELVVTSATRAKDLLWRFDPVRRLSDAQVRLTDAQPGNTLPPDSRYIEPGVLWWAFDPDSARWRGAAPGTETPADDPQEDVNSERDPWRAVVLIDELDKADPDVPNGLLVPLGSISFPVEQLGIQVTRRSAIRRSPQDPVQSSLLVVITTNEERDLPPAFLRRCIEHKLSDPGWERLRSIGKLHLEAELGPLDSETLALLEAVAHRVEEMGEQARVRAERPPSTAEYLDAVRACRALKITVGDSPAWKALERAALGKRAVGSLGEE